MKKYVQVIVITLAVLMGAAFSVSNGQAGTDVTPGQTGNEPNNAVVNPRNPAQVAVAQGCQVRISNDFGQTFPVVRNSTLNCSGDPSMAFDSQGNLFMSHLTRVAGELTVVAGQIADTTTAGNQNYTPIQVSVADGMGDDKNWMAADANPSSPYRDNLYLVWTRLGGGSAVLFSRSTDGGANWSAPQVISAAGEGFVWPAHVAVGPNGDVYVAYHTDTCGAANAGTIPLIRDGNGGANLAAGTVSQKTNAFGAGQATITCNVQASGTEIPGTDFWLQGSMQPWILPDPVRAGNVYVVANDDPDNTYANADDADVVIARSTNLGMTFSRSRVDHGPGQSFAVIPTAHIDQDGNIGVTWHDNRRSAMNSGTSGFANGTPNFLLDLYGTASRDGGLTFTNDFQINDAPFDPDVNAPCRFGPNANCGTVTGATQNTLRIGEYNGFWTVDGIGYATWTGNATPPAPPFPSDGAGAQTTMFDIFSMSGAFADRLEPNESIDFAVVAVLGADDTYAESNLSLHTSADVDFFKVTALHSGKLEVEIEFNEVVADLEVIVQDAAGNTLASGDMTTVQTGSSIEMLAIPVVQGEHYFVEVFDPNAPNTLAPQSLYDLTIVNRAAPVPFQVDLVASSDSGRNNADDVTNETNPTIRMRADTVDAANMGIDMLAPSEVDANDPGYALAVFSDGNFVGYASPVIGTNETLWEITLISALTDGAHSLTAKVHVFDAATPQASGFGGESGGLLVVIDTIAPATPATPDLMSSSDNAGINDDDITTLRAPSFQGAGEETNALVRILANGAVVGQGLVTSGGNYQVKVEPLADGVYGIAAELEDLAGNVSAPSDPLNVTIANQVLNLPGMTADPASGLVTVDLQPGTISGYPGVAGATGLIGIVGIPQVNLDVNGHDLTILGTVNNDNLRYTPTGSMAGRLTRSESTQVLTFAGVGGTLFVDPVAGADDVAVIGTSGDDAIAASIDSDMSVQVNALLPVTAPNATTENLSILAGTSVDVIDVIAFDTVNANVSVDGGLPSTNPNRGDRLNVGDGSGKGRIRKQPGSGSGAGIMLVDYPKTTGNVTTIGYAGIERVAKLH